MRSPRLIGSLPCSIAPGTRGRPQHGTRTPPSGTYGSWQRPLIFKGGNYVVPRKAWATPTWSIKLNMLNYDMTPYIHLLPEAEHMATQGRYLLNTVVGKHNFLFREQLPSFQRVAVPTRLPKKFTRHIKNLTDFIARTHWYPDAYGGFSDVWNCQLQYKRLPPERVAVKAIRSVIANGVDHQTKIKDIKKEYKIWAKLKHPNIVPLYGITYGFGRFPAFVCPWAENGTLSEYLVAFEAQLDMKKRMTLLADIAAGLQYLHSRNVVHGDLSGANVLITKTGRACLADFGLSTLVEQVSDRSASKNFLPGNIRWAAPELFNDLTDGGSVSQLSSQHTDVYSFGSIMLQTLSGKLPFHGTLRDAQIVIMISRGQKPPRERRWDGEEILHEMWEFMEACWDIPPERPSTKNIVNFVEGQTSRL